MHLVCGEALIDLFVETGKSLAVEAAVGGSPFNVAVGLARLGCSVAYLGGLSNDLFGEHLAGVLDAEGVNRDFVKRSARPTTLSFVSHASDGTVQYAFHGHDAADRNLSIADLPAALPDDIRCLTFGSYSLAVEPIGTALEHLASTAGPKRVVSLDPNVRPNLIDRWPAWHRRFERFLGFSTIVKASEEDVTHAFGAGCDLVELGRRWLNTGPSLVVLTRGDKPLLAFGAFGELEVPVRAIAVVDTVGAGDSFHAALIAALDRASSLSTDVLRRLNRGTAERVLAFATVAAALTCSRRGAALPRLAEVEAALAEADRRALTQPQR